ncbi:small ribosomal subunit protein uS11m [Alligator mississippiensis]|uniref:Small ribosomal subunit protein uS11m n=1 Tax=Alligator mississippiensis TaxID=8496 RepID=A0A151M965_ALLMI|nr:small ribosomal subunit protein uS11m [Alligator mississippiensis]KYO21068.1 28S ribosomal protein S11, mitochondrial [Alligator mississippiensis]
MAALSGVWQRLLRPVAGGARAARPLLAPAGARGTADSAEEAAPAPAPQPAPRNTDTSSAPPVPGQESHLRWNGKKYEDIPIIYILAAYNNTHICITDAKNKRLVQTTCGTEGFKNAKKKTPIAAHTVGISAAAKACTKGLSHVRVVVKGLGPGRWAAIQGLTMGGLEIISITDNTPIPHNGCRPRKARRI